MLVYIDLVSEDQVLSDSFPWKELEYDGNKIPGVMVVQSKMVTKSLGEINTGANASAEAGEEELDDGAEKVVDIKDGLIGFGYEGPNTIAAKEFVTLYKAWCQKVRKILVKPDEEEGLEERKEKLGKPFMESAKEFMPFLKKEFKNCEIYAPKSFNTETFVIGWWDDEANKVGAPKFIYFKHALKEEKY
eukprot:snap_masked-scaffold_49-processed-gene-1.80-mRNA-1 protein AED:0.00 eAED:0.00 QI:0/-1/0/1/-1/1/1/0/188